MSDVNKPANLLGDKPRVRLGCMVKPETLEAVKALKIKTNSRSEGFVIDEAIEHFQKNIETSS